LLLDNGMASAKFIASQARSIYQYKDIRIKVVNFCADNFFNRQCLAIPDTMLCIDGI